MVQQDIDEAVGRATWEFILNVNINKDPRGPCSVVGAVERAIENTGHRYFGARSRISQLRDKIRHSSSLRNWTKAAVQKQVDGYGGCNVNIPERWTNWKSFTPTGQNAYTVWYRIHLGYKRHKIVHVHTVPQDSTPRSSAVARVARNLRRFIFP